MLSLQAEMPLCDCGMPDPFFPDRPGSVESALDDPRESSFLKLGLWLEYSLVDLESQPIALKACLRIGKVSKKKHSVATVAKIAAYGVHPG